MDQCTNFSLGEFKAGLFKEVSYLYRWLLRQVPLYSETTQILNKYLYTSYSSTPIALVVAIIISVPSYTKLDIQLDELTSTTIILVFCI